MQRTMVPVQAMRRVLRGANLEMQVRFGMRDLARISSSTGEADQRPFRDRTVAGHCSLQMPVESVTSVASVLELECRPVTVRRTEPRGEFAVGDRKNRCAGRSRKVPALMCPLMI